jgi:predicted ATPase
VLQKVVIEHFRSCENVTIDNIGPSLVLVGPNGSGKTNILKAILWAAESALSKEALDARTLDFQRKSISFEFQVTDGHFRYAISTPGEARPPDHEWTSSLIPLKESVSTLGPRGSWDKFMDRDGTELQLQDQKRFTVPPSTPSLPLLFAYLPPDDPLLARLRPVREFLGRIRYYPLEEPSESHEPPDIITETRYKSWLADSDDSGRPEEDSVLMKLLRMSKEAKEDLDEVKAILGENGLGLIDRISVDSHPIPKAGGGPDMMEEISYIFFYPHRGGDGKPVGGMNGSPKRFRFADLSHGTRRVIRMIVSMIFDRGSVMLIEHPEDGIHRRLTAGVFNTLQAYTDPSQIIVSSHSPLVFDMLDPDEIRIVSMREGKTEVRALTPDEASQARRYVKEHGTLTEYLDLMIEA